MFEVLMGRTRSNWMRWETNYERLRKRRARALMRPGHRENRKVDRSYEPPVEVQEERDKALERGPQSLTALLCGDPLPGRSALERETMSCLLVAK